MPTAAPIWTAPPGTPVLTRAGVRYHAWEEPDGMPVNACADCGTLLTDDDRGPLYDSATDDGTPHACPAVCPGCTAEADPDLASDDHLPICAHAIGERA